jgi:hypothetical protein
MAKPKIKQTITKKEWNKKHKDFKTTIDGTPYVMMYDDKVGTHLVPVKIVEATDAEEAEFHSELDKLVHKTFGKSPEEKEMEESVGAELDLIKQSSKDVKDFLKNVFKDSDFRAMKSDKDFIKYLKSIYEGINEMDLNDPIMIKLRAAQMKKNKDAAKKVEKQKKINPDYNALKNAPKIKALKKKRAEVMRDMEQEAEPEGGKIADRYGKLLNRIDNDIIKLGGNPMTESVNEDKIDVLRKAVQKINRKYKVNVSSHPVTKGEIEIILGRGNHPDSDYHAIEKLVSQLGIKNHSIFDESVVTEAKEPEVITQLRKIVKDKQNALVVDTKSKKKVRVDMQSANLMVQVYDALKQQSNKDKFVKSGIVAMGHMAYKLMKNEGVNEGDGLWANIRAKKARGEKSSHPNSKAYKDAVKAGKKINKEGVDESVNEDTKKRFDVDFYQNDRSRTPSYEEMIRGDKFSDVVSQAIKIAKSKGMIYVEFYYKDAFIGSIDKKNGYEFKKGRSYQKSPLSVNEANSDDVYFKSYTHAIEAAEAMALKKGYTIEDDEMFTKVGMNSKRPSVGKTTKVNLELLRNGKPQKKMLHIQVYGMKNGYELNAYIN